MENKELELFKSTIQYADEDDIFIMPICDLLDISYKYQSEVINKDHYLKTSTRKKRSMSLFGDNRERLTLTRAAFVRWIQILNANLVRPQLVDKLEILQSRVFEYLMGSIQNNKNDQIRLSYLYRQIESKKAERKAINSDIKIMEEEIKGINLGDHSRQIYLDFNDPNKNILN